jgi:hypothetical protein
MQPASGSEGELTPNELAAYNAAFKAVRTDFRDLEKIQEQLNRLAKVRWERPDSNLRSFAVVTTPEGARWNAYGLMLKLSKSEVLLCRQADGADWAIIQRFPPESLYAQAHGSAEILLAGSNVREVATEYTAQAQHTLRFMASNLVAKAQKIAWEQFRENNPARVVQALSERCSQAMSNTEGMAQTPSVDDGNRLTRGIRV